MHLCITNSSSSVQYQAIIWTNDGLMPTGTLGIFLWNFNWSTAFFIEENDFEHVICKLGLNVLMKFYQIAWCHLLTDGCLKRMLLTH